MMNVTAAPSPSFKAKSTAPKQESQDLTAMSDAELKRAAVAKTFDEYKSSPWRKVENASVGMIPVAHTVLSGAMHEGPLASKLARGGQTAVFWLGFEAATQAIKGSINLLSKTKPAQTFEKEHPRASDAAKQTAYIGSLVGGLAIADHLAFNTLPKLLYEKIDAFATKNPGEALHKIIQVNRFNSSKAATFINNKVLEPLGKAAKSPMFPNLVLLGLGAVAVKSMADAFGIEGKVKQNFAALKEAQTKQSGATETV